MRRAMVSLLLLAGLSACGGGAATPSPTFTHPSLVPYQTASPTPTETLLPPLTTLTLPTPTPIMYTIAKGDTLSSIAARYHLSVDDLLAANPGIQAGALVVGKTLVIPAGPRGTGVPLPTPAAIPLTQARCWPESSGDLWCFALLQNGYAETLENLSVQFTLLNPGGQEISSQVAYGLMDILPSGQSMPLAAHFPPPVPGDALLRAQVLTAVRLLPGDKRYMGAAVENTLVTLDASARTAALSGEVVIHGDETPASLWVLAAAYDASGNVVGLRRWEPADVPTGEEPVKFGFQLYSVGPPIDHVLFLAEVKAK